MKKLVGILFFIGGLLLFVFGIKSGFADYSYINTAAYINDGHVDSGNEGKFVIASGSIKAKGIASDTDFSVIAEGSPFLKRRIEMFQVYLTSNKILSWKWSQNKEPNVEIGNQYYTNPAFPNEPKAKVSYVPATIGNGNLLLGEDFLNALSVDKYYNFTDYEPVQISGLSENGGKKYGLESDENRYITSKEKPHKGDIAVSFFASDPNQLKEFTVLGIQKDGVIITSKDDKSQIWDRLLTKDEVASSMKNNGTKASVIMSVIGALFAVIGIFMFKSALNSFKNTANRTA